jgi:hypothetical protein
MDESTHGVRRHKSECPQDQQDDEDGPKHVKFLPEVVAKSNSDNPSRKRCAVKSSGGSRESTLFMIDCRDSTGLRKTNATASPPHR